MVLAMSGGTWCDGIGHVKGCLRRRCWLCVEGSLRQTGAEQLSDKNRDFPGSHQLCFMAVGRMGSPDSRLYFMSH